MKKTAIMSIRPYLNKSIPIGVGTTATCFLMHDKRVLKLFMDTYGKQCLFECYSNIIDHFKMLMLSNVSLLLALIITIILYVADYIWFALTLRLILEEKI